jgi:hypothetical protein
VVPDGVPTRSVLLILSLLASLAACSDPAAGGPDAAPVDASPDAAGKDAMCAATFGDQLTAAFGRIDGTVVAVVEPGNPRCALPNRDHVVVQVALGAVVYRMVVNVQSTGADRNIRVRALNAPLPAPAFALGWHPGLTLDYPRDLGVHSGAGWEALALAPAAAWIAAPIEVGAPIAVYASSSGGSFSNSTHLIHRNGGNADGALVIDPTGAAPRWLLFSFADQTF